MLAKPTPTTRETLLALAASHAPGTVERRAQHLRRLAMAFDELPSGTWILGQFRIVRLLSRGGMGAVYLAEQPAVERQVAVKVLRLANGASGDAAAERFRQEARTASRLAHPNIIALYNFGQLSSGDLFFAMEYVEGPTLEQLRRGTPLAPALAVDIVRQCAEALRFAHKLGVVHRDIKPSNVMLSRVLDRWHVKVLDFGLARVPEDPSLTLPGVVLGTPQYMSPEQCKSLEIGPPSDQYSLGLVFYELLTGRPAVDSPTPFLCLRAHLDATPARPSEVLGRRAVAPFDDVVMRMLAKEPGDRFSDEALCEALEALAVQAGPPENADEPRPSDAPTQPGTLAVDTPTEIVVLGTDEAPGSADWQNTLRAAGFAARVESRPLVEPLGVDPAEGVRLALARAPRGGEVICVPRATAVTRVCELVGARRSVLVTDVPPDPLALRAALGWVADPRTSGIAGLAGRGGFRRPREVRVERTRERATYVDALAVDAETVRPAARRAIVELAQEMMGNALFHAPVRDGVHIHAKRGRDDDISLLPSEQPLLQWARSDSWFAVSVQDPFGSLDPVEAAGRVLARGTTPDLDRVSGSAGMGLTIMARAATHLFFFVSPDRTTEVLALVALGRAEALKRSVGILTSAGQSAQPLGRRLVATITTGDPARIELVGEIDESCDLHLLYAGAGRVHLDLAGVERVNSGGLRAWLEAARTPSDAEIVLERCSIAVVSQLNLVTFFAATCAIDSVLAPYACTTCGATSMELVATREVLGMVPPDRPCAECGGTATLDDLPEEYFGFLERDLPRASGGSP